MSKSKQTISAQKNRNYLKAAIEIVLMQISLLQKKKQGGLINYS